MAALPTEKIIELLSRVLTSPRESTMLMKCWIVKLAGLQSAVGDQAGVQNEEKRRQDKIGQDRTS